MVDTYKTVENNLCILEQVMFNDGGPKVENEHIIDDQSPMRNKLEKAALRFLYS